MAPIRPSFPFSACILRRSRRTEFWSTEKQTHIGSIETIVAQGSLLSEATSFPIVSGTICLTTPSIGALTFARARFLLAIVSARRLSCRAASASVNLSSSSFAEETP